MASLTPDSRMLAICNGQCHVLQVVHAPNVRWLVVYDDNDPLPKPVLRQAIFELPYTRVRQSGNQAPPANATVLSSFWGKTQRVVTASISVSANALPLALVSRVWSS